MTPNEQLDLWVQGNSIHNLERNECCPDFSCCEKKLRWPKERREDFQATTQEVRESMLVQGLRSATLAAGFDVVDIATISNAIDQL